MNTEIQMPPKMTVRTTRTAGFALTISLALMAFVLLLLLSITTMSQVHLRASSASLQTLSARQNALLALNLAIGQLQRYGGKDTSVTATASILDAQPSTPEIEGIFHPFWTGFWDTSNTNYVPAFLVSGNEAFDLSQKTTYPQGYVQPSTPLPDPDASHEAVYLKRGNSTPDQSVKAKRVAIEQTRPDEHSYAYWVGDEGVKAKVNIQTEISSIYTEHDAFRASEILLSGNSGNSQIQGSITPLPTKRTWESRVIDLQAYAQLTSNSTLLNKYSHDITTYSYGLQTNTVTGGLKKDLSTAFNQPAIFSANFINSNGQSPLIDQIPAIDPGRSNQGPNWQILRSYYNLPNSLNAGQLTATIPTPANVYDIGATTPERPYRDATNDPYHINNPILPIIGRVQYDFLLEAVPATADPTKYTVRLGVRPCIALYNPYNVKLSTSTYYIDWKIVSIVALKINGGSTIEYHLDDFGLNSGALQRASIRNVDIEAGETRLFFPSQSQDMSASTVIQMESELNNEIGYFFELTSDATKNGPTLELDATDQLEITDIRFDQSSFFTLKHNSLNTEYSYLRAHNFWPGSTHNSIGASLPPMAVGSLASGGSELISSWLIYLRTSNEAQQGIRNGVDTNFRFMVGSSEFDLHWHNGDQLDLISPFSQLNSGTFQPAGSADPETVGNPRLTGYYGNSNQTSGQTRVILYDVPQSPIVSIGALQHANLGRYNHDPDHIIGNSYRNPRLDAAQTESILENIHLYDLSYLINRKLWDHYFMSSIPATANHQFIQDFIDGTDRLPNSRFISYAPKNHSLTTADYLQSGGTQQQYEELAGKLLLDGAFNINSTSVNAWKVFLASISDLDIPLYNLNNGSVSNWISEQSPLFSKFSRVSSDSSDFWNGYVSLNQVQLDQLATKIVTLIKARGRPSHSLSEFINRSLIDYRSDTSLPDPRLSGILQSALDDPTTGINSTIEAQNSSSVDANLIGINNEQSTSYAGHLRQGDLLQPLGPFMSARSDTFTIRSYGAVENTENPSRSTDVYCEAIVQRFSEPVDDTLNLTNGTAQFGRKYRVIHFRWLSHNEI